MFRNPLFRERALIRNAQPEPLDDLVRVTAPREWLLLVGLAASLLVAVAWCALATVEVKQSSDAVLVQPGDRHTVASVVSGVITEVAVRVGDRVEAGRIVARLKLPELGWRLRVARARVVLLEERAERLGTPTGDWLNAELAAARAELLELAAIEAAGEAIVSPYAGTITGHRLFRGQAVTAGDTVLEVVAGAGLPPEVVTLLAPEQAQRIEAGMKARVFISNGPASPALPATVVEVSRRSEALPAWMLGLGLAPSREAGAARRIVRLALDRVEAIRTPDGAPCRVEVILARTTPFGLLVPSLGSTR